MNQVAWVWVWFACCAASIGCLHEDRRFVNEGSTVVQLPEVSRAVSTVRAKSFLVPRWTLDEWPDGHLARCVRDREWTMNHIPMDYVLLEITGGEIRFMGERVVALMSNGRIDPTMLQSGVVAPLAKRLEALSAQLETLRGKGLNCLQAGVDDSGVFGGNVLLAVEEGVFKETYMKAMRTLQIHGFDQPHFWVTDEASKPHILTPQTPLMVMKFPGRYSSEGSVAFLGSEFRGLVNVYRDSVVLGPRAEWHAGSQSLQCSSQSCDRMDAIPRAPIYDFASQLKRERPHLRQFRVCVSDGSTYAGLMGTLESLYPYAIRPSFVDDAGLEESWLHVLICGNPPKIEVQDRSKKPAERKPPSARAALLQRSSEWGKLDTLQRPSPRVQLSHVVLKGPTKDTAVTRSLMSQREGIARCLAQRKQFEGSITLSWTLPQVRWGTPRNVRIVRTSLEDFQTTRCVAREIAEFAYRDAPGPKAQKENGIHVQWTFTAQ